MLFTSGPCCLVSSFNAYSNVISGYGSIMETEAGQLPRGNPVWCRTTESLQSPPLKEYSAISEFSAIPTFGGTDSMSVREEAASKDCLFPTAAST